MLNNYEYSQIAAQNIKKEIVEIFESRKSATITKRKDENTSIAMSLVDENTNDLESNSSYGIKSMSSDCSTPQKPVNLQFFSQPFNLPTMGRHLYCDHCDYCTVKKSLLISHLFKYHAKEMGEELCNYCGETFHLYEALSAHIRKIHLSSKIVKCWICKLEFEKDSILVNHIRLNHPNERKKFHCGKCSKQFYTETSTKRHHKAAHSNPTIKCDDENCTLLFSDIEKMYSHFISIHKEPGVS